MTTTFDVPPDEVDDFIDIFQTALCHHLAQSCKALGASRAGLNQPG